MFGKSKDNAADSDRGASPTQEIKRSATTHSAAPAAPEAVSSISSGLSIVGKIVGQGTLGIFGHVEGEVHASTVQIGDGARVEGNIVAEELTIGGRVKGTIHANRVRLNSTAVVEGDIYHRSLAVEENAQFDGMSRRQEDFKDAPSLIPAKGSPAQSINVNVQDNGASDSLNPSQTQAAPIDRKKPSTSVPNP
jgi:cytoskeletal protein CcmA (bactofilin family)